MRRGIYCGTFDPVHPGHIAFALAAKNTCDLDEVVFIPEAKPWRKVHVTPLEHRVKLLELALQDIQSCRVATLGSGRLNVAQTMPELARRYPGDSFTLLMGSDVARHLPQWKDIDKLLGITTFAIGLRAGDSGEDIVTVLKQLEAIYHTPVSYQLITTDHAHISSSHLRENALGTHPMASLQKYIQNHELYDK